MTEALRRDFPWLTGDPAEILGDARPRTTSELLKKRPVWHALFKDWLRRHNESYVASFESLTGGAAQVTEYRERF